MPLFNWLQEKVILKGYDILTGQSISESLDFLLGSQFWPDGTLTAFQEDRLRILISHAYENVPFYRDLFRKNHLVPSDIKTIADLQKIPVINKNDLRKHRADYYLAENISSRRHIRMHSSGSTGEPFSYYITAEAYSMSYACAIRGWYWMGYRLGDTYAKLSQNSRSGFFKKLQDSVLRSQYMFIRDLTTENLAGIIQSLNHSQPSFIRCYPDPLLFIACLIKDGNHLEYNPKAINVTGNILTPETREKIEGSFGAPVFDSYSCEASAQFNEDPERSGYLASMEYAITEVLDHNDTPTSLGRHITTDLWNMAMPFIRYDTQDIIERSEKGKTNGLQLDCFKQIKGRNSDILITPSGKFLIVHTFTIFFEYFTQILQFQVIQPSSDKVRVLLVVNDMFNRKTESEITSGLEDLIGKDVKIDIKIVTEIPLLPSGKRKFLARDESVKLHL